MRSINKTAKNSSRLKVAIVMGTRPEIIKMAPIERLARAKGHEVQVIFSGQHRQMAEPLLKLFGIQVDLELDVMRPGQPLSELSARILSELDRVKDQIRADVILVQGDTTTVAMTAYWAFLHGIRVAHVEAGLRTYDLRAPFPEEANRQLVGRVAQDHFAPTKAAELALKRERLPDGAWIGVVGNTAIDSLLWTQKALKENRVPESERLASEIREFFAGEREGAKNILVTAHRRENQDGGFDHVCAAIHEILEKAPGARLVLPVHRNPKVREPIERLLGNHPRIKLIEPQGYAAFVELMMLADLVLTDSGGVQEEAPSLKKPILVLREKTERPEGVKLGFAKLVGTNRKLIVSESLKWLGVKGKKPRYPKSAKNPYGDGKSAERILKRLASGVPLQHRK